MPLVARFQMLFPIACAAVLANVAVAQELTLKVTAFTDAQCTTRKTECGADDVNLPSDGSDCAAEDVTNVPTHLHTVISGECTRSEISDEQLGISQAAGASPEYMQVDCDPFQGVTEGVVTVKHFSDNSCTEQVTQEEMSTGSEAVVAAALSSSTDDPIAQALYGCVEYDMPPLTDIVHEGTTCETTTITIDTDCCTTALTDLGLADDQIEAAVAEAGQLTEIISQRKEIDGCVPSLAFRVDASNLPCYAESLSGQWQRMPTLISGRPAWSNGDWMLYFHDDIQHPERNTYTPCGWLIADAEYADDHCLASLKAAEVPGAPDVPPFFTANTDVQWQIACPGDEHFQDIDPPSIECSDLLLHSGPRAPNDGPNADYMCRERPSSPAPTTSNAWVRSNVRHGALLSVVASWLWVVLG